MKKIAYIINTIQKNGPSKILLELIDGLAIDRKQLLIVTLFEGNDKNVIDDLNRKGITVIEWKGTSRGRCLIDGHKRLAKLIEEYKIEIIHSHGFVPDIIASRLKSEIKKVSTLHNVMFEDYLYTYGKMKSKIYVIMHLLALRKIDRCVCCSKSVYDVMKKYIPDALYVRNGISGDWNNQMIQREDYEIPEEALVMIYVGHISSLKRVSFLVEQFEKYHKEDEYLLVLGDGDEREYCEKISGTNVKILGRQENPAQYMEISDVYVSASVSEGFSVSVLEALSHGLGLLLSDIPSHKEAFMISDECYLGEFFAEDDFNMKMEKIRKQGWKLHKDQIRKFQKQYLSNAVMAKGYEKIYSGLESES